MSSPPNAGFNVVTGKANLQDYERLLVRPRRACHLLDCGTTRLYELLDSGELESFLDGRSRKITVESIRRYITKRLTAADKKNPVPGGRKRASRTAIEPYGASRPEATSSRNLAVACGHVRAARPATVRCRNEYRGAIRRNRHHSARSQRARRRDSFCPWHSVDRRVTTYHLPYPTHADKNPSWRWDAVKSRAYCTCTPSDSIFDVIRKVKGGSFEEAKIMAAEIIGRPDLISERNAQPYSRVDAVSLLNPAPKNSDDDLCWRYLAQRLGVEPNMVPRPLTKVVGIKQLAYFDAPRRSGEKPFHVGDFPAAIFETVDRNDCRHAHRIYLAPGGFGKAELGSSVDGTPRDPKKSARKIGNEKTAGRAVIWGDPSKAKIAIICEGIETATAIAFAFGSEVTSGTVMAAACITAGGLQAFKPWPAARHVIVGADRDEFSQQGKPPSRRGEIAAQKFAKLHHGEIAISIALPGKPGEKIDWLDVLKQEGAELVRRGIAEQVDSNGWRIVAEPPVRFRRSKGVIGLPIPKGGGDVDALRPFLNLKTDADFSLAVSWLVAALRNRQRIDRS